MLSDCTFKICISRRQEGGLWIACGVSRKLLNKEKWKKKNVYFEEETEAERSVTTMPGIESQATENPASHLPDSTGC